MKKLSIFLAFIPALFSITAMAEAKYPYDLIRENSENLCALELTADDQATCAIKTHKKFFDGFITKAPVFTMSVILGDCFYYASRTPIRSGSCRDDSNNPTDEICIIINVKEKFIENYRQIYDGILVDGFRLEFQKYELSCLQ